MAQSHGGKAIPTQIQEPRNTSGLSMWRNVKACMNTEIAFKPLGNQKRTRDDFEHTRACTKHFERVLQAARRPGCVHKPNCDMKWYPLEEAELPGGPPACRHAVSPDRL